MPRTRVELAVSIALVAIVIFFLWEARDWQIRARLAPWTVGFTVLAVAVVQLFVAARAVIRESRLQTSSRIPAPAGGAPAAMPNPPAVGQTGAIAESSSIEDATERRKATLMIAWTIGFCIGLWLLGFRLGTPLLTFGFLRFGAGESTRLSALFALGAYLSIVLLFQTVVGLPFPPGLVFQAFDLQSPDAYVVDALTSLLRGRSEG